MVKHCKIFFIRREGEDKLVYDLQNKLSKTLPKFPFVDVSHGIPKSEDWKTYVYEKLVESDVVVCLVGDKTHESDPVNWELHESKKWLFTRYA